MYSATDSTEVQFVQDIVALVEELRPHVSRLASPSDKLKVRIYQHTVRTTAFINIDMRYRMTRYGLVPKYKGHRTVEPIKFDELCQLPLMELMDLRLALITFIADISALST